MKRQISLILLMVVAIFVMIGCEEDQVGLVSPDANDGIQEEQELQMIDNPEKEIAEVETLVQQKGYPNFCFGLSMPFMTQVPYGDWSNTKNCGQASAAMIGGYFYNAPVNKDRVRLINQWLKNRTGDSRYLNSNGYYTGGSKMGDFRWVMRNHQALKSFVRYGSQASTPVWYARYGYPVIVGVMISGGNLVSSGGVAHWAVVVGWDGDVIVHDPGSGRGRYRRYSVAQFEASWATQGKIYMPIYR